MLTLLVNDLQDFVLFYSWKSENIRQASFEGTMAVMHLLRALTVVAVLAVSGGETASVSSGKISIFFRMQENRDSVTSAKIV